MRILCTPLEPMQTYLNTCERRLLASVCPLTVSELRLEDGPELPEIKERVTVTIAQFKVKIMLCVNVL